jgi:hypothetical protein
VHFSFLQFGKFEGADSSKSEPELETNFLKLAADNLNGAKSEYSGHGAIQAAGVRQS